MRFLTVVHAPALVLSSLVFVMLPANTLAQDANENSTTTTVIGNAFPVAATASSEMSLSAAFDGENYLIGIQSAAALNNSVGAQLVSQSGSLLGSYISTDRTGGVPTVAYSGENYLMVWADDATSPDTVIYGQIINRQGELIATPFAISETIGSMKVGPYGISCNTIAVECAVIWYDQNTAAVYTRNIGLSSDSFLTPETTVEEGTLAGWPGGPAGAACDNSSCLAVYDTGSAIRASVGGLTEVIKNTFVLAGKNGACPTSNAFVAIVFDGTNYLVVWNDFVDCSENPSWSILAQRLNTAGDLLGGPVTVNTTSREQFLPSVAFDGERYLITWTDTSNDANGNSACDDGESTCWDIAGQYLDTSANLLGSEFSINSDAGNQLGAMTYGGGNFLVIINERAPENEDVYAVFVTTATAVESEGGASTPASGDNDEGTDTGSSPMSGYNGVAPNTAFNLSINNIGVYDSVNQIISTCTGLYVDGVLTTDAAGKQFFNLSLKFISAEPIRFQLVDFSDFNPNGILNENGDVPDCSGQYDVPSQIFSDIVQVGEDTFEVMMQLEDVSLLTFLFIGATPVEPQPEFFSVAYLQGKTFYEVYFGTGDDVNGNLLPNVPVVGRIVFGNDGTVVLTGLLNSSSDSGTYDVDATGVLFFEAAEGGASVITCGGTTQYIKTEALEDGVVDSVDLYFFRESDAFAFASTLIAPIPRCDSSP